MDDPSKGGLSLGRSVLIYLAAFFFYLLGVNGFIGIIGDNVVYIRDAERLRSFLPFLDYQYGFGLKLLLAIVGSNLLVQKGLICAITALIPLITHRLLGNVWVTLLTATLPTLVQFSTEVTADTPYTAFALLTFTALPLWATLAWAYHVKAAAIVLLLVNWKRWKQVAIAVALIVPWMIFLSLAGKPQGYFQAFIHYIDSGYYLDASSGFWGNLWHYVFVKSPTEYWHLLGLLIFQTDSWLNWVALGLILAGFPWKHPQRHDWYVLGYAALLLPLPGAPIRYLLPIAPFLLSYFLRPLRALQPYVAIVLLMLFIHQDAAWILEKRSQQDYVYWESYHQAALWCRDHTPADARIAARKPTLVWYWSKRESDTYPFASDYEGLRKFDYVIVDNLVFPETKKYLIPMLAQHLDDIEVVHHGRCQVVRLNRESQ